MARFWLKALLCLCVTFQLFAADVAGKWTAETKGRDGNVRTMTYDFKVDGENLTGTVSSPMGERAISEGKVKGDEISFIIAVERNGETMKMPYTGKIVGEELKLSMNTPNGSREVVAKRVK
jgi:hypothetical protein